MAKLNILNKLGLERAISTQSETENISESQSVVLKTASDFDLDFVYFNTDENLNSFPAVFIKEVESFDSKTLEQIADTQKKIWNYKKVLFLYVYSDLEIRIYSCTEKPLIKNKNDIDYEKELKSFELKTCKLSDKAQLKELTKLFSSIAIDTGIIWTIEEAVEIRKQLNLQRRVDKYLVESLVNTADQLKDQGLEINYIHKIILRSLFLLYLEDRGATDEKFYSKIKDGTKSYFDILDDVDSTLNLYKKLEDHFNGNVFTIEDNETISKDQLQLIKKCFISGNENTPQGSLFEDWRLFDFSIIQIELLSEVYENFLFKTDPELKKQTGTYYTPPSLVEFILNEKLPVNNGETEYNIKVLDPSCGSGIFLVECFKRLVKRHENFHQQKLTDFDTLKKLLTDNIYGIELHPQAIKVAAFSLYLALVDNLNPKNIWQSKKHRLPYLINNPQDELLINQGSNLYCRDTIDENTEVDEVEFDLVIGNPPFGTSKLSNSIKKYCTKHNFAKEMVLPFLHKATKFCPNGQIALIFNTKVLTNTGGTYQNFREWLFNDCYVDKVFNFSILRNAKKNFGGQLFGDATGPISIVYYQKEKPQNPSNKIVYYAPKTFIKSNVIEGLSIDYSDLKYLPREECQKPDTKIWKVAMWGGMNDWGLIQSFKNDLSFGDFLTEGNFIKGLGLQFLDKSTNKPIIDNDVTNQYLKPQQINRYYTSNFSVLNDGISNESKKLYSKFYKCTLDAIPPINVFRRLGRKDAYKAPHILIKEGLTDWKIYASFVSHDCSFNSKVIGIHHPDSELLKGLVCFLNSKFTLYYIYLISASIGIEREEIKPNELYRLPMFLTKDNLYELSKIFNNYIFESNSESISINTSELDSKIDDYIFSHLSSTNTILINDFNSSTLPLLKKNIDAIQIKASTNDVLLYSKLISTKINSFIDNQILYANVTTYLISHSNPLMMIKISFDEAKREIDVSKESLDEELNKIDGYLWEKKSTSIYFRKKLNYKTGNDIYIIRPNQRRFWSKSMALEDATELINEILNDI